MQHILSPVFQERNQVQSCYNSAVDQISNILKSTGQTFDAAEVTKVVDTLRGKKLEDVFSSLIYLVNQGR